MDSSTVFLEAAKVLGFGTGGTFVGYFAQKQAAKSEAIKELQVIKTEYKEFAEFTKKELTEIKLERKECASENAIMLDKINLLNLEVNDLTMAMHNIIGTAKGKEKPLNNKK